MNLNGLEDDELIFSLDIGTRTIIGMICKKDKDGRLQVLDYSIREHEKRNMYDGQIHDIEGVSKLVKEIKEELEKKQNIILKTVSVAAAGRALKTKKTFVEHKINKSEAIESFAIETLELEGVQRAQKLINEENNEQSYYSIGYTVSDYYLDEIRMDNLKGHKGERIGVEILATFLPKIVIEGLYSVISRVGLEISTITLEPIAAINISIEKDLRLLNLALVDIGAGTSDIAITDRGQIISYDMTQSAGDEITESILKEFLLDFNQSDKIKKELSTKKDHIIKNILGIEKEYTTEEIIHRISDSIDKVADNIVKSILRNNKKTPDAIFLIGGTSQMFGLRERIAEKMEIPKDRVSVRDLSLIKNISIKAELNRPDMITPIGIAAEGLENKYRNFINVKFQNEDIQVFNTNNIKVSDIMVLTDFNPRDLLGKKGEDFIYYREASRRVVKGNEGEQPNILVNGEFGSLQTILKNKDIIEVTETKEPEEIKLNIYDLVSKKTPIENIFVNGNSINEDYILKMNDNISIIEREEKKVYNKYTEEIIQEELIEKKKTEEKYYLDIRVNDKKITIEKETDRFIFVDVFDYIDFDRSEVKGNLCLKLNGEPAEYMKALKNGDNLEIYWD